METVKGGVPPTFGNKLRAQRLAAGLSQEALAERARISVQAVGALERGDRRTPQRETLALLLDALNLDADGRRELEAAAGDRSSSRLGRVRTDAPESLPSNLPHALTSFVGRDDDLRSVEELVGRARLVTVTGAGGFGKTRLALEVATKLAPTFDGAYFVDFSSIADPTLVAGTVGVVVGVRETAGTAVLDTLRAHLRDSRVLLLFDNCEHVVDEAARVAQELLRACASLHVLATSREPLRAAGEHTYRLAPLPAPSLEATQDLRAADAAAYPAVQLFIERARAVEHRFRLVDDVASSVAEVCARLDGIPLALELAAARVTALGVRGLAEMLERRFALPGTAGRAAPGRQQAMRATIDWSYDLLSEPERLVFEGLGVFAGGCTLDAATAVCALPGAGPDEIVAFVESLVDKSLLLADAEQGEPRYRLLESFRQYAREKLTERGTLDDTLGRHAETFASLAEQYERNANEESEREARAEFDNCRAALEWSLGGGHAALLGQRLAAAMRATWYFYGPAEGDRWLRLAIAAVGPQTAPALLAKLELVRAAMAAELGEFPTALASAERSAGIYRSLGDALGAARAQVEAATALVRLTRPGDAKPLLLTALDVARTAGERQLAGKILNILGWLHGKAGEFDAARAACEEARTIHEALGQSNSQAVTLVTQGEIEFWSGNAERAMELAHEALECCRSEGLRSTTYCNLAAYHVAAGRLAEAHGYAHQALEIAGHGGFIPQQTWALQHLAAVASTADPALSARLMGYVEKQYAALGERPEPTDAREYEGVLKALRATLTADALAVELARGAAMSEEEALMEAARA